MKLLRGLGLLLAALILPALGWQMWIWFVHAAMAQGTQNAIPTNHSIKVTLGLTYQAIAVPLNERISMTFENNVGNPSGDICYVDITGKVAVGNTTATSVTVDGAPMTAAQASITLSNGGAYGRYIAWVPAGVAVVGTCTTTGDALYADTQ